MKFSEMPYKHIDMDEVKSFFEKLIIDSKNAKSGEEQFELHKDYYRFVEAVRKNQVPFGFINKEILEKGILANL